MADITKTTNELMWGPAVLLVNTLASNAVNVLGYTVEPIDLEVGRDMAESYVQELTAPVINKTLRTSMKVSGTMAQVNSVVLGHILGITPGGGSITIGGEPEEIELDLRIISSMKNRAPFHLYMPRAKADSALKMAFGKDKMTDLPFGFSGAYDSTLGGVGKMTFGNTIQDLTLVTGSVTRVQAAPTTTISWIRIAGEGGAADAMTDIAAADLANNEIVRVCIVDAADAITLTHATGVIELKDSTSWVMNKLADWIDLQYDLANTKWVELTRYDAP